MLRPTAETLRGIEIFADLSTEARRALASHCQAHYFEPNDRVVSRQDASTDVYFIVSGRVRVTIFSRSGKEVSFRDLGPGHLVHPLGFLGPALARLVVVLIARTLHELPRSRPRPTLRRFVRHRRRTALGDCRHTGRDADCLNACRRFLAGAARVS